MDQLFREDSKVINILESKKFTISAEVIPPRNGTPYSQVMDSLKKLTAAGTDFISVTKGAGGSLRGGSLPIAQSIKDHFHTPAIAHFTCRDLSPEEVENHLIDHHHFGIRNILALRGDPPVGTPDWIGKDGSWSFAYQLIEQIRHLNNGNFLQRKDFNNSQTFKTDFCIGAAAYPDENSFEKRSLYFQKKVQAGAEYGITQMLFSIKSYSQFLAELKGIGVQVPILPGTRLLKSQNHALRMKDRFSVQLDPNMLAQLSTSEDEQQGIDTLVRFCDELKDAGAPGIHLFVMNDIDPCCKVIQTLKKRYS